MFRIVFFDDLCHRGVSRICHTCARRVLYSFVVMREARNGLSFSFKAISDERGNYCGVGTFHDMLSYNNLQSFDPIKHTDGGWSI